MGDLQSKSAKGGGAKGGKKRGRSEAEQAQVHTSECGTPTYTAPEIVNGDGTYGLKADVWSMGIVLYELFDGKCLDLKKDTNKEAFAAVEELKAKLSDKPIPKLLKAMLQVDPEERVSAEEALQMLPKLEGFALPAAGGELLQLPACEVESEKKGKRGKSESGEKGQISPEQIAKMLGVESDQTLLAAQYYWQRCESIREMEVDGAAVCALLACKMFEACTYDGSDVPDLCDELEDYDPSCYAEAELDILKELHYCLELPTAASPVLTSRTNRA